MIRTPATLKREEPLTTLRTSLKAYGTLTEADQLIFLTLLLCLIYKVTCSLTDSEKHYCVQTGLEVCLVSAWELILLVLFELSYTEIIVMQFSANLDSIVWKLYKNAFHVSLSLNKTCIWLGTVFLP